MRFLLLGSVQIRGSAGDVLARAQPIQRTIAAALMLRAPDPVPTDELVDWLWADEPPRTSRNVIQLHISRLRAALAADRALAGCLVSERTAYRMAVEPEGFDLHNLRTNADAGRRATAAGDHRAAMLAFDRAMVLWRGTPFGRARTTPRVDAVIAALEEERLRLLEHRIDAALAVGDPGQVIGQLRGLVASNPLRERFHEQLMLALHTDGRQAEALAVYANVRAMLIDELGVEPGSALREAHRRVLSEPQRLSDPVVVSEPPSIGEPPVLGDHRSTGASPPTGASAPAGASARAGGSVPAGGSGPAATAAPSGAAPSTATGAPFDPGHGRCEPLVPAELPRNNPTFTGRTEPLRRAVEAIAAAAQGELPILAIDGPGGVGKSALALRVAHLVRERFPDGQLYLNLDGATLNAEATTPGQALGRMLRSLGASARDVPPTQAEAAARFRSVIAGRRILVVLDNARDEAQVRDLLPGGPPAAVIVTSRSELTMLDGAVHLRLDMLPEREAIALLAECVGDPRIALETEETRRIARLCGYLPLSLRIAAARIVRRPGWSLAAFADRLSDCRRRLDELSIADAAVRSSFLVSYTEVCAGDPSGRAAAAFRVAGLLDGPEIGVEVVAAALDCPVGDADEAMRQLYDARLVEPAGQDMYRLHDLIRLFAAERAAEQDGKSASATMLCRVLNYAVRRTREADLLMRPAYYAGKDGAEPVEPTPQSAGCEVFADRDEALAWLERHRATLVALVRQAARTEACDPELIGAVARQLGGFFDLRAYWSDWEQVGKEIFELGRRRGLPGLCARARHVFGAVAAFRGRTVEAEAELQAALRAWTELDDPVGQIEALNMIAYIRHGAGQLDQAAGCLLRALLLARRDGRRREEAVTLGNLGEVYSMLGRYTNALRCHQESLAIKRSIGDLRGMALTLHGMGRLEHNRGNVDEAVKNLGFALEIYESIGARRYRGEVLYDLGLIHQGLGDAGRARRILTEAAEIVRGIGDTPGLAQITEAIAALPAES